MLIIVNHQILRISKLIHATHSLFPFNSLTTKFFQRKKKCMQKKKKKNQDTQRDSNSRSRELELNALTTWLLHYIAILENYKTFITNLSKKFWRPF